MAFTVADIPFCLAGIRDRLKKSHSEAEWYAGKLAEDLGCPRENGYPCQGVADLGRDVVTHAPELCWVRVAQREEGADDEAGTEDGPDA